MSILSRIFGAKNQITVDSALIKRGTALYSAFTGGVMNYSSVPALNEGDAYTIPTVSACVQVIAGAISSLPTHVFLRQPDGDLIRQYDHDLWWVLNESFSGRWTSASGWWFLTASKLLYGDAFAEIKRDAAGRVKGLVPIHPLRCRVLTDPDGERLVYSVSPDATIINPSETARQIRVINADDMLHVPGFGFNGLRGLSMLQFSLRTAGNLSLNAQTFSAQFFKNSARPEYALKTDGTLTDDQYKRLQEMIEDRRGPDNAGKQMILEGGLEFQPLTMPMGDMELLETRKFGVEEICRAFGVPPFMVGHTQTASAWGTGLSVIGSAFVRYSLRDHLTAFHDEMNRKIFPRSNLCIEFDTLELERGDMTAMMEAVRIGLGRAGEAPFISVAEARQVLRFPKDMPADPQFKLNPPAAGAPPPETPPK